VDFSVGRLVTSRGRVVTVAAGNIVGLADDTHLIFFDTATNTVTSNTTGTTAENHPLAVVVVAGGTVTAIRDIRKLCVGQMHRGKYLVGDTVEGSPQNTNFFDLEQALLHMKVLNESAPYISTPVREILVTGQAVPVSQYGTGIDFSAAFWNIGDGFERLANIRIRGAMNRYYVGGSDTASRPTLLWSEQMPAFDFSVASDAFSWTFEDVLMTYEGTEDVLNNDICFFKNIERNFTFSRVEFFGQPGNRPTTAFHWDGNVSLGRGDSETGSGLVFDRCAFGNDRGSTLLSAAATRRLLYSSSGEMIGSVAFRSCFIRTPWDALVAYGDSPWLRTYWEDCVIENANNNANIIVSNVAAGDQLVGHAFINCVFDTNGNTTATTADTATSVRTAIFGGAVIGGGTFRPRHMVSGLVALGDTYVDGGGCYSFTGCNFEQGYLRNPAAWNSNCRFRIDTANPMDNPVPLAVTPTIESGVRFNSCFLLGVGTFNAFLSSDAAPWYFSDCEFRHQGTSTSTTAWLGAGALALHNCRFPNESERRGVIINVTGFHPLYLIGCNIVAPFTSGSVMLASSNPNGEAFLIGNRMFLNVDGSYAIDLVSTGAYKLFMAANYFAGAVSRALRYSATNGRFIGVANMWNLTGTANVEMITLGGTGATSILGLNYIQGSNNISLASNGLVEMAGDYSTLIGNRVNHNNASGSGCGVLLEAALAGMAVGNIVRKAVSVPADHGIRVITSTVGLAVGNYSTPAGQVTSLNGAVEANYPTFI